MGFDKELLVELLEEFEVVEVSLVSDVEFWIAGMDVQDDEGEAAADFFAD